MGCRLTCLIRRPDIWRFDLHNQSGGHVHDLRKQIDDLLPFLDDLRGHPAGGQPPIPRPNPEKVEERSERWPRELLPAVGHVGDCPWRPRCPNTRIPAGPHPLNSKCLLNATKSWPNSTNSPPPNHRCSASSQLERWTDAAGLAVFFHPDKSTPRTCGQVAPRATES